MLTIKVPMGSEEWDIEKEEFVEPPYEVLELEHSLVSISKWESKWRKAFLSGKEKTAEETLDYIKFMTLTENVDPDIYNHLTRENIAQINEYIEAPMTATVLNNDRTAGKSKEVTTSELVYFWMISQNIPFECQHWHLNRLLTLIKVCSAKNNPPSKRSKGELMRDYAAINKANRERFKSKG